MTHSVNDYTVNTYKRISQEILRDFYAWRTTEAAKIANKRIASSLGQQSRFLFRRQIAEAERTFKHSGATARWLVRLFLCCRDRNAVIDYLRFQEQAHQTHQDDPLSIFCIITKSILTPLGKRPNLHVQLRIRWKGLDKYRFAVPVDPFVDIRRTYSLILKSKTQSGFIKKFAIRFHISSSVWRTYAKCVILRAVGRKFLASLDSQEFHQTASKLIRRQINFDRTHRAPTLLKNLDFIFKKFDPRFDLETLISKPEFCEVLDDTDIKFRSILSIIKTRNSDWSGILKFIKVFIGGLVGEHHVGAFETADAYNAVKRSFCWASTYPLVDDVLDDASTAVSELDEVKSVMREVFQNKPLPFKLTARASIELRARMHELMSMIPSDNQQHVKRAVTNVFEAHRIDAMHRLSTKPADNEFEERMQTSLLKSLLVRVATMSICNEQLQENDIKDMARVAIFNQLGDDIWDTSEDLAEKRATPITVSLNRQDIDPFAMYIEYGAYLLTALELKSAKPISLAIMHTFFLAYECSGQQIRSRVRNAIGAYISADEMTWLETSVLHIDPDSLLFDIKTLINNPVRREA